MSDERVKDALNAVQFERDCVFVCCTEQLCPRPYDCVSALQAGCEFRRLVETAQLKSVDVQHGNSQFGLSERSHLLVGHDSVDVPVEYVTGYYTTGFKINYFDDRR